MTIVLTLLKLVQNAVLQSQYKSKQTIYQIKSFGMCLTLTRMKLLFPVDVVPNQTVCTMKHNVLNMEVINFRFHTPITRRIQQVEPLS